jgi:hypothetical protein
MSEQSERRFGGGKALAGMNSEKALLEKGKARCPGPATINIITSVITTEVLIFKKH